MPVVLIFATVTMLVLRAGASRIFFDVVGSFQATRLIGDAQAKITVLQGLVLDGLSGITEGIGLIGEQMQALVDSTVPLSQEIGFARIEFEKFVAAGDDAEELAAQIENLGLQFGFAGDQALAAGARMAQLSSVVGGGEAIPAATQVGIAFGMVGGMETEEAMKRMIALQQQTGFMFGELTNAQFNRLTAEEKANQVRGESIKLLNQLNTIENRSSATMAQMTMVMNQFASSAKLAGDEITFMAAASATLIEAGEEQGKAGRALKMIYARLGADTGKNSEILRKFGIETKINGNELRSLEDIVADVAAIYPSLTNAQRLQIAQAVAGNDHYVRAIKLFEGQARTLQLQTMAVQELDTAESELNKRFEDNAFLLVQAESRLKNANAAMGELFTPSVIRATNAQAALNEALVEMAADTPGLTGFIDKLFGLQQMGQIFAPMVEANLNMMSLTVSLQTQLQIQRAIAGQALVNASAYGRQGEMVRANLMSITNTVSQQNRQALVAASLLNFDKKRFEAQQQLTMMGKIEQTDNRDKLLSKRTELQNEIQVLQAKENQLRLDAAITSTQFKRKTTRAKNLDAEIASLQVKKQSLGVGMKESIVEEMQVKFKNMKGLTEEKILGFKDGSIIKQQFLLRLEEAEADVLQQQNDLTAQITNKEGIRNRIVFALTRAEKDLLNSKIKELKTNADLLAAEGKRNIMALAHADIIEGETMASKILRNAHMEIITITNQKSSAEVQNTAIMEQAEIAARELAFSYNLNEAALRQLIPDLQIFRQALDSVEEQSKLTVKAGMGLQMFLMKVTGVIGGASMALSFFTENENAAKASMLLMQISMIPMTAQMITATTASFGLASGLAATEKAGIKAAISLNGVKAAAIGVGKAFVLFAAVGAIAAAAMYFFTDQKKEVDGLDASLSQFNQTVSFSKEQYEEMLGSLAAGVGPASDALIAKENEIAAIREDLEQTTNPALIKQYQAELDILEQEAAILHDITAMRQANLFKENQDQAIAFFNTIQDIRMSQQELDDELERQDTFGGKAAKLGQKVTEMFVEGAGGAFGIEYETDVERAAAMEKAIEDSFSAIPEHLHGAIMEAALASETFEEFMNRINAMAMDENLQNPFANFPDDIEENFIGPIEAAKEAAFEFSNAREEMFFGMSKGNITGDMVKQVVNKGVETLINTTEVIMTNNFTGMTTTQAANEITKQVVNQLNGLGLNIQQPA